MPLHLLLEFQICSSASFTLYNIPRDSFMFFSNHHSMLAVEMELNQ